MNKTVYGERLVGFDEQGRAIIEVVGPGEVMFSGNSQTQVAIDASEPHDPKLENAWRKF